MTEHNLTIQYSGGDAPPQWFVLRNSFGAVVVSVHPDDLGFDLDAEALRDWIESQRPRPRFTVKPDPGAVSGEAEWTVVDRGRDGEVIAACEKRTDAERIAAALNAQEAES